MGAAANATGAPRAALLSVLRRSIEQDSKTLTLRGSGGNKLLLLSLEHRLLLSLLLTLKLWGVAAGAREAATEEASKKPVVKQPTAKQIRESENGAREASRECARERRMGEYYCYQ